jgi:hypothetical protein
MKLIDDTLKSPQGKYSRKNLTMFISIVISVALSFIIVIKYESNAIAVLYAWLAMATGQSILALRDKIKHREHKSNIDEVD